MTLPHVLGYTPLRPHAVTVSPSARVMGTAVIAGIGSGKTTLLADLALQAYLKRIPQVLFDPLGTLTPNLLFRILRFLQHVPPELHSRFWERIRYVDLGAGDFVVPFPIYSGLEADRSLWEIAERYLTVLHLSNPGLLKNAPISWPQMHRLGVYAGMLLASLGFQLTEVRSLLFNTREWERSGLFAEALKRCPEAGDAVAYFREEYLHKSQGEKGRTVSSFLDHSFSYTTDPQLKAVFCASAPGISWQDVADSGQTVIIDFRNVWNENTKRFAMLWVFLLLVDFLKQRGRKETPVSIIIDEFAALTQQVTDEVNPLAVRLDAFIQQYMRNTNVWFTCAFQSLKQLDEQLRQTVLSLGNYVIGRAATPDEARLLADVLYKANPYRVKYDHRMWMSGGSVRGKALAPMLVDLDPEFMRLSEQQELQAQQLTRLGLFEFLLRPATREGEVSARVLPISIANAVVDQATGEYQFPEQAVVDRLRAGLSARDGIPIATILKEIEQRLAQFRPKPPDQAVATPAAKNGSRAAATPGRPVRLPAPAAALVPVSPHLPLRTAQETQSHPTLTEEQKAMLAFLIEHPDTSIAGVYKGLGISGRKGTEIRDSLREQGFLL